MGQPWIRLAVPQREKHRISTGPRHSLGPCHFGGQGPQNIENKDPNRFLDMNVHSSACRRGRGWTQPERSVAEGRRNRRRVCIQWSII